MKVDKKEMQDAENSLLHCKLKEANGTIHSLRKELFLMRKSLGSANEELLTTNLKLQDINLELQSVNEELCAVNLDLQRKFDQILTNPPGSSDGKEC